MKKMVAWTLLVSMIVLAFAPLSAFADDAGELEKAIRTAKEKFSISDEFTKFDYDADEIGGRKNWRMTWRSDEQNDGTIRVSVDSDGMITSYMRYKPSKYEGGKLPAVSREAAADKADAFMEYMEEGLALKVEQNEYRNESLGSETFWFSYHRMENGVPFYDDTINVEVKKQTGEVTSYFRDWSVQTGFPATEGVIGLEKAQEAYRGKIGMELIYKYRMVEDEIVPYLVYVPKETGSVWIDAFTGDKITAPNYYYRFGMDEATKESSVNDSLTPEELGAIEEMSELIDAGEAEGTLREWKEIGLDEDFELVSSRLEKVLPDKSRFRWSLSFRKIIEADGEETMEYGYGSVDALSGEILSFGISGSGPSQSDEIEYTKEEAIRAVEEFLKKFAPERIGEFVYEDSDDTVILETGGAEKAKRYYSFNFTRMVEGTPFRSNRISVGFDAVAGKISNYRLSYFDVEFPTVKNVAEIGSAYSALYEKIGLELLYVDAGVENASSKPIGELEPDEVKLAYGLKTARPAVLDAVSLELLNNDGSLYIESKDIEYEDLEGHYSKVAVDTLAENGIKLEGELFRPDEKIAQKDFFILFVHTMGYHVPDAIDDKFIENMYAYLVREEIIEEADVEYTAPVTRGEAVKYIVRGLGYEKVAVMEEIFADGFSDVDRGYPELRGYVAIANGLGIVEGYEGSFNPGSQLKRGDAAIMIYNRLSR